MRRVVCPARKEKRHTGLSVADKAEGREKAREREREETAVGLSVETREKAACD